MTTRRVRFEDSIISWDLDACDKEDLLQTKKKATTFDTLFPLSIFVALAWFVVTSVVLWWHVLPGATEWWTAQVHAQSPQVFNAPDLPVAVAAARMMSLDEPLRLPGGYRSVEEMDARSTRFPSIDERVRVYMSNWYQPPCARHTNSNETSDDDTNYIQYNYLRDENDPEQAPLLVLKELKIPMELLEQDLDSSDPTQRKFANSGNNRIFVLDNTAIDKGARLFYMTADKIRACDQAFCLDFVRFIFPSLHRTDMSVQLNPVDASQQPLRAAAASPGNALDGEDGNSNAVVPVVLQFGDLEISRAWVVTSGNNETYPAIPIQKKFRRYAVATCCLFFVRISGAVSIWTR